MVWHHGGHPIVSAKLCPDDDKPTKVLTLLVELLRSGALPDLAIGGALFAARECMVSRPAVGCAAFELGLIELVAAQLPRSGAPSDWLSTAYCPGKTARGHLFGALNAVNHACNGFSGSEARPDLDALVSSGLLDQMVSALRAFEEANVQGLQTADRFALLHVLSMIKKVSKRSASSDALIRSAGSAIAFAMEHSLDACEELGWTTGGYAASLCEDQLQFCLVSTPSEAVGFWTDGCCVLAGCAVFGRDEAGGDFSFTQQQVDTLCDQCPQQLYLAGCHHVRSAEVWPPCRVLASQADMLVRGPDGCRVQWPRLETHSRKNDGAGAGDFGREQATAAGQRYLHPLPHLWTVSRA